MTSANLWAGIALLALGGWALTLFILNKSLMPQANALNVLQKVNAMIDDRVIAILERLKNRRSVPKIPGQPPAPADDQITHLRQIFGDDPLVDRVLEQPEPEVIE